MASGTISLSRISTFKNGKLYSQVKINKWWGIYCSSLDLLSFPLELPPVFLFLTTLALGGVKNEVD
jgi:hypothetical protein